MSCCLWCFTTDDDDEAPSPHGGGDRAGPSAPAHPPSDADSGERELDVPPEVLGRVHRFRFSELAAASKNFADETYIGEGASGRVYRGYLYSGQTVALKLLRGKEIQTVHAFVRRVLVLSALDHPNLVKFLGFGAGGKNGDQRVLVYDHMTQGSLDGWLGDLPRRRRKPLPWNTRVRIATDAARGLLYLHEAANPRIIHRNLKSANILLDDEFNAKISDSGLTKGGPALVQKKVIKRVVQMPVYCAPEYPSTGILTAESDVYSFGVILLELLTGRLASDPTIEKQTLVQWVTQFLDDESKFTRMADPSIQGRGLEKPFCLIVQLASTCIREDPGERPGMQEVVAALEHAAAQTYEFPRR